MGIYPNPNDQTSQVIAALDIVTEDYDNRIASSCGSVGRSHESFVQLLLIIGLPIIA
ncbi:hypothetical protein P0R31_37235 [Bradyrhizobium yuanmingense]|uniref:hypothetical protein n=1 Tax=Bradyrhizobium yuanmingense TaxID=108015 RepID=UPI0023B90D3A|nr:hypothetical protein [Bradyrhizobium yuanmingense]MDF0522882.1 hypothetical protein [Bradyrhizobium yuanmingense]